MLDTLLGGILLTATAGTSQLALSLFDAKSELTKISEQAVKALADRRDGLGRLDQTQRMAAAHAILVVAAFFDAVRDAELPLSEQDLLLIRSRQARLAGALSADPAQRLGQLGSALAGTAVPRLSPAVTLQELRDSLTQLYSTFAERLTAYIEGLAAWDELSETERKAARELIAREIPQAALRCWDVMFPQLAVQFPEMQFYVDRADHAATRERVGTGLLAIQDGLRTTAVTSGDLTRDALSRHNRAELARSIIDSGDAPQYLHIPTLMDGYVDPDFRVAEATAKDAIHREEFWGTLTIQDDLDTFLVAQLSSLDATARPLLVLGQPGAGKSVLTKILAGHLPQEDFLVVRVVLRQVPADADVQTQIEEAIRQATGEQIGWPAVSRAAERALRVVILDGFDELLQASGVGHSGYLREVAKFQERETDQDRPVAVVVTSRVSVADRALIPTAGVTVLRLEPFREVHVRRWLAIWNEHNAASLSGRGLKQLTESAVRAHGDLAGQPLLLLMLALYDADGNGLQQDAEDLSTPDLYERLLERFARREVEKDHRDLREVEMRAVVQQELHQLSMVALTMFHRGRQWATYGELDHDLPELLDLNMSQRDDFRLPASPATQAVGRFFFIHRTRSQQGGHELNAVEFLHATFGEYLVSRLIVQELRSLVAVAALASAGHRQRPDTNLLLNVLAFTPLTVRATVMETLRFRAAQIQGEQRELLKTLLLDTFRAVTTGALVSASTYAPKAQTPAGRQAMTSLNLLLLLLCVREREPVHTSELFPHDTDSTLTWRDHATLWYSQCTDDAWTSLISVLKAAPLAGPSDRDLELTLPDDQTWSPAPLNPLWSAHSVPVGWEPPFGWVENGVEGHRRTVAVLNDGLTERLLHALEPLEQQVHPDLRNDFSFVASFVTNGSGTTKSAARALMDLWIASGHGQSDPDALAQAYYDCLSMHWGVSPDDWRDSNRFYLFVLRQLAADADAVPQELLEAVASTVAELEHVDALRFDQDRQLAYWLALALAAVPDPDE